jgi:hypothetical protein
MFIKNIKKNKKQITILRNQKEIKLISKTDLIPLIILLFALIFLPSDVFARDLTGGITSIGSEVTKIMMIMGPLMLIFAGGVFWFSKQAGVDRLISTIIGIVLFAASGTIFTYIYRAFN